MKISDIKNKINNYNSVYKFTDLDNFFSIYEYNGNYNYNLNSTIYLNINESLLKKYVLTCDMYWPLISYKIYETTRLAWLLMKLNNVEAKDVFKKIKATTTIKYIDTNYVQEIIQNNF